MSADLRIQVTQQLVTLLGNPSEEVRQRSGKVLRDMNQGNGEDAKLQKEAAMAGGVGPLVELLKDGLRNERVEAQEYALWSLSMQADVKRSAAMVSEGIIPPLIKALSSGMIGIDALEHAAIVVSCLALDRSSHEQIMETGGITPLVQLLDAETVGARKNAAIGLARLALGSPETQTRIAEAGAVGALVEWLVPAKPVERKSKEEEQIREGRHRGRSPNSEDRGLRSPLAEERAARKIRESCESRETREEEEEMPVAKPPVPRELKPVAALALADLARSNAALQSAISEAGAMKPLIIMLTDFGAAGAQKAACSALATLAEGFSDNQIAISEAGGIPPLVELLKSSRTGSHENAARAISMLALHEQNKASIGKAAGIEALVGLLTAGNDMAKQHAAQALQSLASDNVENQVIMANSRACSPLVALLSVGSDETAASAVAALLCLVEHGPSQKLVIKKLVEVLGGRSTSAQLKAAEAFAALSSRNPTLRAAIVKAGAIEPLVALLGTGHRADLHTPPERAAAVLADLSRIADSKAEIARCSGIAPLVKMLSSTCKEGQAHAAMALYHSSTTADNKVSITTMRGIPLLVRLMSIGSAEAQRHAAGTLWNLATSADNKTAIVDAGGIQPLVALLLKEDHQKEEEPISAPTPRRRPTNGGTGGTGTGTGAGTGGESLAMLTKGTAAAVLSELARSQASYRVLIVKAGAVAPLTELLKTGSSTAQKHATCAVWGLTGEPKYRKIVAAIPGAVERLVEMLRSSEGEAQGYAAATLACLAEDENGKEEITAAGGAGPLMTIALGPDSWLRTQCLQVLKALGYSDPTKKLEKKPEHSPRMIRLQQQLAAHPELGWMCADESQKQQPIVNEEHMSDLACKMKIGLRVLVDPGERKAEVAFVGKIPDIAPGWWVGVHYDDPVGRNDGSVKGLRFFECAQDFGGFLRPDHIHVDPDPPPSRLRKEKDGEEKEGAASAADEAKAEAKRRAIAKRGPAGGKPAEAARSPKAKATGGSTSQLAVGDVAAAPDATDPEVTDATDGRVSAMPMSAQEVERTGAGTGGASSRRPPRRPPGSGTPGSGPPGPKGGRQAPGTSESATAPLGATNEDATPPASSPQVAPGSAGPRSERTRRPSIAGAPAIKKDGGATRSPGLDSAPTLSAGTPEPAAAAAQITQPLDDGKPARDAKPTQTRRGSLTSRAKQSPRGERDANTAAPPDSGPRPRGTSPASPRAAAPASSRAAAPPVSARGAPLASARAPQLSARGNSGALTERPTAGSKPRRRGPPQ